MSVAVVVDDILISTSNESEINLYAAFLQQKMIKLSKDCKALHNPMMTANNSSRLAS